MKLRYLILTPEFAEAFNGHQEGANVFSAKLTNDGDWVVSSNAENEFPSIFENKHFPSIKLSASDFPSTELPDSTEFTLEQMKAQKDSLIERETERYISGAYNPLVRDALQASLTSAYEMRDQALAESPPNTAVADAAQETIDNVNSVWTWAQSIMGYNYQKLAEVAACENLEDLALVTWDFSQFDATNPHINADGSVSE